MPALTNVTMYNLQDEVVLSGVSGMFTQSKGADSFDTTLELSSDGEHRLAQGGNYYAVGLAQGNVPVRTEVVQCLKTGTNSSFKGSVKFPEKPQAYEAKSASVEGDSGADILIQYTNYSSTQFNRSTWGSNLQVGFGGLTTSPGPTLLANAGQQSIGASQILGTVDEGPADIYLCWANSINYGVWIHFNFQMFGIGPRPVWYVSTNGSDWQLAGSDPSDPYTWDASSVGFNIVGTPTSGHSSLTVSVIITNLNN
jgi:hypothetical protein